MNKHSRDDLKQMQALPLGSKIAMTKRRIREWYEHWDGQVYVSFSGGKDSTVLKHYVDGIWQPSKEGLGMGKVLDYIHVKY